MPIFLDAVVFVFVFVFVFISVFVFVFIVIVVVVFVVGVVFMPVCMYKYIGNCVLCVGRNEWWYVWLRKLVWKQPATDYEQTTFHSMCVVCKMFLLLFLLWYFMLLIPSVLVQMPLNRDTTNDILWKSAEKWFHSIPLRCVVLLAFIFSIHSIMHALHTYRHTNEMVQREYKTKQIRINWLPSSRSARPYKRA